MSRVETAIKWVGNQLKHWLGGISPADKMMWGGTVIALFRQLVLVKLLGQTWFLGLPFGGWSLWEVAVGSAAFVTLVTHITGPSQIKMLAWGLMIVWILISHQHQV